MTDRRAGSVALNVDLIEQAQRKTGSIGLVVDYTVSSGPILLTLGTTQTTVATSQTIASRQMTLALSQSTSVALQAVASRFLTLGVSQSTSVVLQTLSQHLLTLAVAQPILAAFEFLRCRPRTYGQLEGFAYGQLEASSYGELEHLCGRVTELVLTVQQPQAPRLARGVTLVLQQAQLVTGLAEPLAGPFKFFQVCARPVAFPVCARTPQFAAPVRDIRFLAEVR